MPYSVNFWTPKNEHFTWNDFLDDEIGFISHVVNGRSDSCDAIQEVDEEADLDLDGMYLCNISL